MNMKKPIPYDIDMSRRNALTNLKEGGYAVLYKCPHCSEPCCIFLERNEKFCHNCGQELDWGIVSHLNRSLSDQIDERIDDIKQGKLDGVNLLSDLLDFISRTNETIKGGSPRYILDTQKTLQLTSKPPKKTS